MGRSQNPFWQDVARKHRDPIDHAELLKLKPLQQTAELLARGYSTGEIADVRGLCSTAAANAQVQRIRAQLGWQAV